MSQITTHILDTSIGKPAKGIEVRLSKFSENGWNFINNEITNQDGRAHDLLSSDQVLKAGRYRLIFLLEKYYKSQNQPCFYPEASVVFNLEEQSHYHIPLLLSPYGYSTYRGS